MPPDGIRAPPPGVGVGVGETLTIMGIGVFVTPVFGMIWLHVGRSTRAIQAIQAQTTVCVRTFLFIVLCLSYYGKTGLTALQKSYVKFATV